MIIPETAVTLKDGTKVILRSPQPRDAAQLNEYLHLTSGETHYMVRYPEECDQTLGAAQKRLQAMEDHERSFMLAAFLDGELVGNCGVNEISDRFKMRHRASLGISIKKKAWGLGLGTLLMEKALEQAKENGYVTTLFGRRRYLPELKSSNHNLRAFGERVALNTPIQGTAADIMKIAMVNVYARLRREGLRSRLILQIHDELIVETALDERETVAALLREEMENAAHLSVRLTADVSSGRSWYEAKQ